MTKRLLSLFILCALAGQGLLAQVTTSSLTGTIKTTANAPLAGATVTATLVTSGTVYSATTTSKGQYNIQNMRVGGPYQVKITYVGYTTQTFDDVYLRLAEAFNLDATMSTGDQNLGTVTVTAGNRNSLLSATRKGTTTNIGSRQILTLPTISRSINDLTRLTPQATSTNTGAIGGGNYRQNFITVDGSDFNNTFGIGNNLPAGGSPISIDALGEISINVTPYDVKQSGFIGSAINAVTRAGTNEFSGSAYTFWRNESMQGNKVGYNTPFAKQNLAVNTYGARLGGPIIKNKLFFFVNFETGKTTSPGQTNVVSSSSQPYGSSSNVTRPTAAELDSFSSYLRNKYNYETGPYQGYDNEATNTRITARIDWNISRNHKFNIRYSQVESKSPSFVSPSRSPFTNYSTGVGRTDINALWYKNTNYYQDANFYSLAAELTSNLGRVSNVLRLSFTNQNDPRSSDSQIFPFVDILKDGTPFTSFGYEPFTYGNLRDVKSYSLVDYATWTKGRNSFTAGLQADLQYTRNGFQRFGTSYYTFNSWSDFVNGVNPRDFGITFSLLDGRKQAFPKFGFGQFSAYGQDEIAVSKNFRVTAGLRVDLPQYLSVDEIKTHPLVDSLRFANGEEINTGTLPKTRLLFSPRIGFNWDVMGDRSIQVRGGSGIFTGRVPTVWLVAQSGDAGLIQFTKTVSGTAVPGPFNPDPNAYIDQTAKPGTAIPSSVSAIDRNFKFPQSWKSSLAVDAKLPGGIIGTLEGIYNKDINVALGRNPNLRDATPLSVGAYPDTRPIYGATVPTRFINTLNANGIPTVGGTSAFNPVVLYNRSQGYYWSITAKLEKQFSHGLQASVAYVYSQAKNLFDGSGDQLLNTWSLTSIVRNSNDPELSYANYVVPNRLIANISYRKEYLKHLATTVSMFYEGSIQGRFSYTYSSDFNRDGQTNDLIYVPKDASEIVFAPYNYGTTATPNVYSAQQQSDIFFKLVESDEYLRSRKGKYAERNGAQIPWRNQFDLRLAQDIFTGIGKKRNTIQFTWDVFNFGNFINKNWGVFRQVNASSILVPLNGSSVTIPVGYNGSTTAVTTAYGALGTPGSQYPIFRLQTDRGAPVESIFRENNSLTSTYYMQFGLRYIFN